MKKLLLLVTFLILAGVGLYWPSHHYVVRTDKGVIVLEKRFLNYSDTWADVRTWASADFDAHPDLKRAMIDQGYKDMLRELKSREVKSALSTMADKAEAAASDFADKVNKTVDRWLTESPMTNAPAK